MRIYRYVGTLVLVLLTTAVVSAQKVTCSCQKEKPWRKCATSTTCNDGCTSLCGPRADCFSSCRKEVYEERFTVTFVKKTGEQIASELSALTHQNIEFTPYRKTRGAQYDVEIKNDDIFNVLNYLNKLGTVRLNGTDFSKLRLLENKKANRKKQISKKFHASMERSAVENKG